MHFPNTLVVAQLAALLSIPAFAQAPPGYDALVQFYDYGGSPPVYPSPEGEGTDSWAAAYNQARALVAQMTNAEKQNVTIPVRGGTGCSGTSGGVPRLGYPGLCLSDAGNGLRATEGVSGYPSGIHDGASWNRQLSQARGYYMGMEYKAKGVNMILGPVVGPIGRVAEGGRNWEGISNDPYLAGQLVSETVTGLQRSIIACTKHFVGNEQETNRNPSGYTQAVSSNIDDRTMHELYLWPFQDAVRAGTGAIMCSYNRLNNSYGCQNSKIQNGLLKTELGYQGLVVSDWGAQHSGVASANAGLDMVMPSATLWNNLTLAVSNGSLAQARLDDMATRIVASYYRSAPFSNPGFGMPASFTGPHNFVNARTPASAQTILQGAMEGHVLVKNVRNTLPLRAPRFLSLFGYDAVAPSIVDPGDGLWSFSFESLNISRTQTFAVFGGSIRPQAAYAGTLWVGGGSGGNTPPYVDAPYAAFVNQAKIDGTWLAHDFASQNPVVDPASDACVVMINEFASEGFDRPGLADPYSDTLVLNVASKCSNTIVVIHNAGVRVVDAFYDHPNVTAIIYAHLPGQDTGTALVRLMYGYQSFSGRLPYTVPKQASDFGALLTPTQPSNASGQSAYFPQSNFTEGVYIDYKSFIQRNIHPRFPFGFGLTYTNFRYSNIAVSMNSAGNLSAIPPAAATISGGNPRLFDTIATVTATITNTGRVAAMEVPQLYVGIPKSPPKQLRGFTKQMINPGMGIQVSFPLTRRDLSIWDVNRQEWVLQSGQYSFKLGKDVLDIVENTNVQIVTS